MDVDTNPAQKRSSRKHLLSSDSDGESECSSDVSGRFDDAIEVDMDDYCSPSTKSVKRRRSNDWPLPEEAADYGHHGRRRNARHGSGNQGTTDLASNYKASPRASPRSSATSLRGRYNAASNSPHQRRGRRSRFVEATMSDSVSERPPSIFLRDRKPPGTSNRQSGIFRFGKAIASAFNPFGNWGRSSPEHPNNAERQKDALTHAEEAYAELKRAGYQGTNKGAYLQSQYVDSARADQTWQAIQEKMDYGTGIVKPLSGVNQQEHLTPSRSSSKASKRSSFQDLRKGTSLGIGIPFIKSHDSSSAAPCQESISEDVETPGVRRQKSRKELSRQAKLLKKVSNLEDKLERARRELRQLSGNEQRVSVVTPELHAGTTEMDPGSYPRKFVPGALPTLPSERLLDQQREISESREGEASPLTALSSVKGLDNVSGNLSHTTHYNSTIKHSAKRLLEPRASSMGKESSSRKRKSPVPEPIASRNLVQSTTHDSRCEPKPLTDADLPNSLRPPKWQKLEAGDSPGSMERKRQTNRDVLVKTSGGVRHRRSQSLSSRSSPKFNRSPTSKSIRSSPPLRMSRRRSNLRSVSPSTAPLPSSPPPCAAHDGFYLQQHSQLNPDLTPCFSPSPTINSSRKQRTVLDEDIPPVPPLPKELLMKAASVNPSASKAPKLEVEDARAGSSPHQSSLQFEPFAEFGEFLWPEDIF